MFTGLCCLLGLIITFLYSLIGLYILIASIIMKNMGGFIMGLLIFVLLFSLWFG